MGTVSSLYPHGSYPDPSSVASGFLQSLCFGVIGEETQERERKRLRRHLEKLLHCCKGPLKTTIDPSQMTRLEVDPYLDRPFIKAFGLIPKARLLTVDRRFEDKSKARGGKTAASEGFPAAPESWPQGTTAVAQGDLA